VSESVIEIEIMQPGRTTGEYQPTEHGILRLAQMFYPEVMLPFDIGILPNTMTSDGDPLKVVLIGETSHPPRTQISARLLGGVQTNGTDPYLLAVSSVDERFAAISSVLDLADSCRGEIDQHLRTSTTADLHWLNKNELEPCIKQARVKYRLARVKSNEGGSAQPAWKPVDSQRHIASYTESVHYTTAEYTFFQLPYHFQHYVSEYLDKDERILYAVRRPAMRSQRLRSWLGREKLQEGVLILTTQRLIQLVELVPLGDSGVRYGFKAQLGVLERFVDFSVEMLADEVVLLKTKWQARGGCAFLEWESPLFTQSDIEELISFLKKFAPININPSTLQRSTIPAPSELTFLSDPASNDPQAGKIIHQHFADAIPSMLFPDEQIYAWALWPAWFENKGFTQVMVVTESRVLVISDPDLHQPCTLNISLLQLATLEYVGSILNSYIEFNLVESEEVRQIRLSFPYTAEGAFQGCFQAIRRSMAILPVSTGLG
jgi:inorganic pyrophosphatase